jgi:geranylgeranyl diphosphate/geranylgeranyl-bacteriochlorophyllide a reductase
VEIVSDYIIAADGVNSRVRASLGIKPLPALLTASATVKGPDAEFCEFWFGASQAPYSYSWAFPTQEGLSVGTGTLDPKKINLLFEKFLQRSGMVYSGKKQIYKIPVWQGVLFNRHNVLFAGDAAGQVLPLSYEGIYYAMKAGELAARAVSEGKAGHYKKMWKGRFQKRFMLLDKLKNYFLKNDDSAERLIALHQRPEIQKASLLLWLRKDTKKQSLLNYIRLFGKFLR